ncbi:chemotaxis protein CheC [Anaerosalibacter sp. Marseille-P3206]|uniref:chemotaxis protein CheC n=1 Tax=Anaerosalibacter sp. Marseille-P3206 TaxID=1871005 RepID=UPI0009873EB4|nr:chemotaxis protein CheC [Anaerosalibacter sp. Marseille-P3206]
MSEKDLKYDILKEIFNIGVGKAADMLSEIVEKKIILNVPNIEILNSKNKELDFDNHFSKGLNGTLMVSSISFEEKITGEANLIFPAEKMRTFINLCMKEDDDNSAEDMNFTDIDFDIIKEIGNIILNSIMGEIGNFLNVNLEYTLPKVSIFDYLEFKTDLKNNNDFYILMLYITFILDDTPIEGAVIINLTLNSLNELMKIIEKMEDDLYG